METNFFLIRAMPVGISTEARVIKARDYQIMRGASGLLEAARKEADRLLLDTVAEAEVMKKHGYEAGKADAEAEMAEAVVRATILANDIIKRAESELIGLVKLVLEKVFSDLDVKSKVLGMVRSGLVDLRNERRVLVRVAPEIVDDVAKALLDAENVFPNTEYCEVVSDSRLAPDAYVIEGQGAIIRCSVADQFQRLNGLIEKALSDNR